MLTMSTSVIFRNSLTKIDAYLQELVMAPMVEICE